LELRSTNSQRTLLFWLLAAALLGTIGCGHKSGGDEGEKPQANPAEVTVTKVQRTQIVSKLLVSGNLAAPPNRDAKVAALVPGRIARVLVAEGEAVAQGQALAELDSSQLRDQERQAEAAVAQARANVENARLSADRQEGLLQRGIAARKEVEDARTQLAVNQGALAQSEAALALALSQGISEAAAARRIAETRLLVRRFLEGHWLVIKALAAALWKDRALDGPQAVAVITRAIRKSGVRPTHKNGLLPWPSSGFPHGDAIPSPVLLPVTSPRSLDLSAQRIDHRCRSAPR